LLIAGTGDIHHPKFTHLLESSLNSMSVSPDAFLIAGDVLKPNDPSDYSQVMEIIDRYVECPLVAAFGNTEFSEDRDYIREQNPSIVFLDDESCNMKLGGIDTLIVGSTGSLERPTSWQKRNIPHINDIYKARVETVSSLLKAPGQVKILLLHYAPTYLTLEGERKNSYPWMGTRRYEAVVTERRPDAVIHAHAHNGSGYAEIDGIPIYNVSLPLNEEVVTLELGPSS